MLLGARAGSRRAGFCCGVFFTALISCMGTKTTFSRFLRQQGTTVTRKHLLPMQRQALLLILATLMASSAATAQAPPTPATPPAQTAPPAPARNATGCAPTQSMPQQGTIAPQGTTTTDPRAEPLSDKLARSDGVLCPPTGVDPEIRAPTPETGNMPVIPPPGSPGGDPTIRPK